MISIGINTWKVQYLFSVQASNSQYVCNYVCRWFISKELQIQILILYYKYIEIKKVEMRRILRAFDIKICL